MGGRNNQFTFPNDPIPLSYQHDVRRLPNGHITIFDNGNYRVPPFSRAVEYAAEATRRAGLEPKFKIIRGGTDGAQLTEKGLPTPNLSTGEHNPHSPLEWTCLEEMTAAVEVLVELVQLWGAERA